MSLEITGKLTQLLPVETGQGKNGQWTKQPFVIETEEQYPKKVCISAWNDNVVKTIQNFAPGTKVKASISIESREWNGRWYTDVRAWRIDVAGPGSEMDRPAAAGFNAPPTAVPAEIENSQEDDLPF
jgi:hypothetical protein